MRRGDVLPAKGLICEALGFTSLFFAEGGGDSGTQGTINIINVFGGLFTKGVLIKV